MVRFSPFRFAAIVSKEFVQMRRDRLTFAMMIGIPLLQLILFGYAINTDPKHLPTAILCADNSPYSRSLIWAMKNSDYFTPVKILDTRAEAQKMLKIGQVQFVLSIPQNFARKLIRGEKPVILLEADATDPAATSNAVNAFKKLGIQVLNRELKGPLQDLTPKQDPVTMRVHAQYNPEGISQYNIVPGLMGVILTLTLVMITSLAVTRERERGTMENLLSTPVRPLEVMVGKIIPYILVGYVQMLLIMLAGKFLFQVPMHGNLLLIFALSLIFIAANLSVGVTFSTIARNQLQAVQLSVFFFLPSLLLSGFMFPFRGMPAWAQYVGSILPLTHYLRLVRGILLKGNGLIESWYHVWPISVFLLAALLIGLKRYRLTLE